MTTIAPVNQTIRINILRLAFVFLIPLIFLVRPYWHPDETVSAEIIEIIGFGFLLTGIIGRFWSILYAGGRKNTTVLQDGPFSLCRHPLYLFSILGVFGFGLMLESITLGVMLGGTAMLILYITAKREENYLRTLFGSAYDKYAEVTPMFLPRFSRYRSPEWVEFSTRALKTNAFDALVFVALFPLVELVENLREYWELPFLALP